MKLLISTLTILSCLIWWKVGTGQSYPDDYILEVAFPSANSITAYEPTKIRFAHQYVLLENIYSPLIDLGDTNSEPFAAVARMFYWRDNEFHLVIREDLKTIDGYLISVDDVEASLKRLMILSENTHGDFKNLICPETELKSIQDDCPRMVKKGNTLILRPKLKQDYLVPMLSSIDFAIISKTSFDPVSLKITDYRNTTGPYYVEEDRGQGHIILKSNPAHFRFEKEMPQEVHLIPTKGMKREEVIGLFNRGKIDHITTIDSLEVSDFKKVDSSKNNFHETIHIQTTVAYITEKGKKRIPLKRRLSFAKALQKSFGDYCAKQEGCRPTREFFFPLTVGDFSRKEETALKNLMDSAEIETSGEGIHLGILLSNPVGLESHVETAKVNMPKLKVEKAKGESSFTDPQDSNMPDYIMVFTDSGFLENIGLISYSMNEGILGLSKKEGKAWLREYMDIEDKLERIKKIRAMHLQSLTQGWMIPLYRTPYVAMARRPWKMHLPELFANNPFWKIRKEH